MVKSIRERPWCPVMRCLQENEQPDDEPVMGNRDWKSRRVSNETVTRVKPWRNPQPVMKSWENSEIPWAPVKLE